MEDIVVKAPQAVDVIVTVECKEESRLQQDNVSMEIVNESCRVCMANDMIMSPIFDATVKVPISVKLSYCTGLEIKEDDGKPKQICLKCLTNLNKAHEFKTCALNSDETFQKYIKGTIKREQDYSDNEFDNVDVTFESDVKEESVQASPVRKRVMRKKSEPVAKKTVSKAKKPRAKKPKTPSIDTPTTTEATVDDKGQRLKNGRMRRTLYCVRCDIHFENRSQLVAHTRKEHATERYMCEHCGKIFKYPSSHQSHILTHLPPAFPCNLCSYSAYTKCDLGKHMRTHSGEKNLKCPHCPKTCSVQSNLNAHIRNVHLGERPHKCHLCDKAYYDKSHLTRHLDSHNDIRRYACEFCATAYRRRRGMIKHVLKIHGIVIPTPRPGRHKTAPLLELPDSNRTNNDI